MAGKVYTAPAATKHHCRAGGDGVRRPCSYLSSWVVVIHWYSPQLGSALGAVQSRGGHNQRVRNSPALTHGSTHKGLGVYHTVGGRLASAAPRSETVATLDACGLISRRRPLQGMLHFPWNSTERASGVNRTKCGHVSTCNCILST